MNKRVCCQCRILPQPTTELEDDEDVAEERERVLSGEADDDLICLKNLTKVKNSSSGPYKPKQTSRILKT